jgi:phospholipid/cholesterol/gamma-HCH transport system ATP-binding protein
MPGGFASPAAWRCGVSDFRSVHMSEKTDSGSAIAIRNLVTRYGDREILRGVSLDIRRGETFVILGGSGCGKSTLLRHIVGLEQPTGGEILIQGKDITRLPEAEFNELRKKIGMAFQNSALFNSMSVGENVALPLLEHTKLEDSTIQIMTRIKLEQVGLSGFESFMPSQLSGGMRKRAGIARALAMDPEILLFDEPSAGLDPIIAAGIDNLILKLKKAFRMTIVLVTHELASAFLLADRMAMLDKGKILFIGTPEEIRQCTIPRVRQFLDRQADEDTQDVEQYLKNLTRETGSAGSTA